MEKSVCDNSGGKEKQNLNRKSLKSFEKSHHRPSHASVEPCSIGVTWILSVRERSQQSNRTALWQQKEARCQGTGMFPGNGQGVEDL